MKYYYINPIICLFKISPKYVSVYAQKNNRPIMVAKINKTAYEILTLCNGNHTKDMIIEHMKLKYSNSEDIAGYISDYIDENVKIKLLLESDNTQNFDIVPVIGSEYSWIPEYIAIDMTNNCPLRCRHCYLNAGQGNIKYLDSNMLRNICNEIIELGIPMVQLTGGEPLLHKDIFSTMKYLQKNGVSIQLFTSGYINDESIINKLLEFKSDDFFIQVSIDGLENFHNFFRGGKDAFKKSMDFIRKMTTHGVHVMVATCISEQSEQEILQLATLLKDNDVKLMRIGYVSDRGRASKNCINNTGERIEFVKKLKSNLASKLNSNTFKVELMEDFDKHSVCGNCGLGQLTLKIDAFGDIYPCIMSSLKIGNYSKESIKSIQCRCAGIFADLKPPCSSICGNCEFTSLCSHCIIEALLYCNPENEWFKINNPLIKKVIEAEK